MRLIVNGNAVEVDPRSTVDEVVQRVAPERRRLGTAVAVNGEVVPKSAWPIQRLAEGDRVEVLHAVGGG